MTAILRTGAGDLLRGQSCPIAETAERGLCMGPSPYQIPRNLLVVRIDHALIHLMY